MGIHSQRRFALSTKYNGSSVEQKYRSHSIPSMSIQRVMKDVGHLILMRVFKRLLTFTIIAYTPVSLFH